jgi:hypothetical protein
MHEFGDIRRRHLEIIRIMRQNPPKIMRVPRLNPFLCKSTRPFFYDHGRTIASLHRLGNYFCQGATFSPAHAASTGCRSRTIADFFPFTNTSAAMERVL